MTPSCDSMTFYDVILAEVDRSGQTLTFLAESHAFVLCSPHVGLWTAGAIGCLTLRQDGSFRFYIYPDQRLRRAPRFDDASCQQWGWMIAELAFHVQEHIVPGLNGQVVRKDTQRASLEIPQEFRFLCEQYALSPEQALRGFIADACGLHNLCILPREDGYTSNGSDERLLASQYWTRAYSWRQTVHASPTEGDEPLLWTARRAKA